MEVAPKELLFANPRHPYTRMLLSAIPRPDPTYRIERQVTGELPSPTNPPAGCRFHTRCPHVIDRCRSEPPLLRTLENGHTAACHRAEELPPMPPAADAASHDNKAALRMALYAQRSMTSR